MPFTPPTMGELRHRVALQSASTTPGAAGALTESYTTVATVSARITVLFGGRKIEGAQTEEVATHVMTIRWRADWQSWRHVLFPVGSGGRRFEVRRTLNPDERREWLELMCEEMKDD